MKAIANYTIVILLLLSACDLVNGEQDQTAVARVGDQYLYLEELQALTIAETGKDSAQIVDTYIDNWIKEQLLLQKAKQNLTAEQLDFEDQLEDYRNSLIIYAYETELVKQKLDTNISRKEVSDYYNNNTGNFELKESIYKARFIKYLNSAPNQDSLKKWFQNEDNQFDNQLSEYCTQFTIKCQIDTSAWIVESRWKEILPIDTLGNVTPLKLGFNEMADSAETVMVEVNEILQKGDTAPVEFVAKKIRSIIKNQRRLKLISNVKQGIFEEATIKRKYEIYE